MDQPSHKAHRSSLPPFEEALKRAESNLSRSLGGCVTISVHYGLDDALINTIRAIDNEKFREELRYDESEIEERGATKGFLCLIAHLDGQPVAFDYGYDDEEGVFFSDSSASLIERKGLGTTLFALEIIHDLERGYRVIKLVTEEMDDQGRALRGLWERFGFEPVSVDPLKGIEMSMTLTHEAVADIYQRYIGS
jgi:hypothetical protein